MDISRKFGKSGNRLEKVEERRKELKTIEKLSMTEIHKLADLALKVISVKVKHYAGLMNVQYGRITIRNQKTRWGSCSSKGNLNFNCLLMLVPDEVVDYVVIHELCHLIEMNHSKAFWKQVEQMMPDYKKHRKRLFFQKLSMTEIHKLADLALKVISVKVKHYAGLMNVQYGRITIRNQKTRWGSCSSKGNLNFNCLLMLVPDEVVDYVVIHELCHLIEMNHSKAFWKQVEQMMPDYKKHRKRLFFQKLSGTGYILKDTSKTPFFHHVALLKELKKAADSGELYTYHFNILRNILEKTASFHGYKDFSSCLRKEDEDSVVYRRIINLLSHGNYSIFDPKEMVEENKEHFKRILNDFLEDYKFNQNIFDTEQVQEDN